MGCRIEIGVFARFLGESMEIVVLAVVALLALWFGFSMGAKTHAKAVSPGLAELARAQAIDRANYLQTLRRELANILIWRDPRQYLALYKDLHTEISGFNSWQLEAIKDRLKEVCKTYPNYNDFDQIGTREYVLYADGTSMLDNAEIIARYSDIVRFEALSLLSDSAWKEASSFVHTTSAKELDYLATYAQRVLDTQLRIKLERIVREYYLWRGDMRDRRDKMESDEYTVQYVEHFAENRYGIHIKSTSDYALYTFFVHDDPNVNISYHYYRSDPTFQSQQSLRDIRSAVDEFNSKR